MLNKKENIPFLDLITPHLNLEEELTSVFREVLRSARFIGGPMVEQFERNFAKFCNTSYCVGLNSGTDAVRFALIAAGIREGDVVLTVANTFIATVEGISQAGAIAEFIEINEETFSMDPQKLKQHINENCIVEERTNTLISKRWRRPIRGIVPVHLYGLIADMDPILEIAKKYNLIVVEDACQAHGSRYFSRTQNKWLIAGSIGDAAAFSFYPGKNLGAMGEGGAVTTNSQDIAKIVKMLRDHGQIEKYIHEIEGYNGRLDALQAGILDVKLKYLEEWNRARRERAHYYTEKLSSVNGVICFKEPEWGECNFHLYIVRVPNRKFVQSFLEKEGIGTGLHYPVPLHLQKAYTHLHYRKGDFPITEKTAEEILSLPMFPTLTREQQDRVIETLIRAVREIY
ncbi:MAG: DegT/DnrJ/EryC1/StrS family aminotransferase [Chitinispirillaceae bacterium]|nr:DegT/DnrJ/EryC1/StrS family aminotransferase [Chitinispirillaceae bacterium]